MALLTSDDNYNEETRYLEQKVVIHFSGISPLEVTRDNYLVTTSILEEAHSISGSIPFGGVTSNEIDIDLINEGGIFSPTNTASPYYNKMRRGVKIEVFIRPKIESDDEEEQYKWDPMGVFYVTEWHATITGLIATITANDKLHSVFDKDLTYLEVLRDTTQYAFYKAIFAALHTQVNIDDSLTASLKCGYIVDRVKELLTSLGAAALADCYCNHVGTINVTSLIKDRELRATITDANQIISATIDSSISSGYGGAEVVSNVPQESKLENILTLTEQVIKSGSRQYDNVVSNRQPLLSIGYIKLTGAPQARVTELSANATTIAYSVENLGDDYKGCILDIFGSYIETTKIRMTDEGDNLLSIDNIYVQSPEYAQRVYDHIKAYINSILPVLEITVRGNPKFELCDKIRAVSEKYNLDYTGLLIKQTFDYDGGLSSKITLLNINILQEVGNGI